MAEKEGRGNPAEGDDSPYVSLIHLRSESEEGCMGCMNAYMGCADVNTWIDLRAIIHDHVNYNYPSINNRYY